jgi:hypothetical protein
MCIFCIYNLDVDNLTVGNLDVDNLTVGNLDVDNLDVQNMKEAIFLFFWSRDTR